MSKKKDMNSLVRDEQGAVLIIFTLVMVVLLGFAALAIDGGLLYFHHIRLQDIADAMALAGATEMAETNGNEGKKKSESFKKAIDYAEKNNLVIGTTDTKNFTAEITYAENTKGKITVSFPDGIKKVKVNLQIDANLYFARVFSKQSSFITVSATATIEQAGIITGGLIPVGIVDNASTNTYQPEVLYEMTLSPGEGFDGNYSWLDFEPSNYFNEYLEFGYDGTLTVGDNVKTYTGVNVGLAAHAVDNRIASDTCTYNSYTSHDKCPRLVYVPIINNYGDTGRSEVTILGFAAFFLEEYHHVGDNITLLGRFVAMVAPETVTPSDLEYNVHAVRLVD